MHNNTLPIRLNTRAAASYLGVPTSYLEKLRIKGGGPTYIKFGKRVVYEVTALDEYAKSHTRIHTSE